MLRVLSNLPLPAESHSIRTFGDYLPSGSGPWSPTRERRDLADILPLIPASEKPDALIISSPEYLPIPCDIASFPGLRILLITDWNMCLRFLPDLCSQFDFCFVDLPGYRILREAGVPNVHHQPMFGHDPAAFFRQDRVREDRERNLDVSFCGNLNAGMHRERNRLLARLARWGAAGPRRLHLGQAFGNDYVELLNRSRLVFNYSIRGEANMRLFEAMACGAVPLVEAGNLEVPLLFEPDRHYFPYEPTRLEETLEAILSDPARIEAAAREAHRAVAMHTKGKQIQALLEFTGQEAALRPRSVAALGGVSIENRPALKALVKMRVLGAAYTMPEALAELQTRDATLPGLLDETLPGALLNLLEDHPGEPLEAANRMLKGRLDAASTPGLLRSFFRMRLHALRHRWPDALDASDICLAAIRSLETGAAGWGPYPHFLPPIGLGKGLATDLNRAYREDIPASSHAGYLTLLQAHCLEVRSHALMALDRPAEALECATLIPADRFVSVNPHPLRYEACRRLGDAEGLRVVIRDWAAEMPLDWTMWDKVVEGLSSIGADADLIVFLEDLLILARCFLKPDQVERVRTLLESRRAASGPIYTSPRNRCAR